MRKAIVKISCVVLLALLAPMSGAAPMAMQQAPAAGPQIILRAGGIVQPLATGAESPESIPDEVALRALFLHIVVPPNPDAGQTARLRIKAGHIMLDEEDFKVLTDELGRFHGLLSAQNARIAAARDAARLSPTQLTFATLTQADRELSAVIQNTSLLSKINFVF
jgi:hypothetical protein